MVPGSVGYTLAMSDARVLHVAQTPYGRFEVVETMYGGRRARVLYSGNRQAAQSGIPLDGQLELLFDYNQRFLELAQGLQPARVLLLGGGACTLPAALLRVLPKVGIDVVEPNGELVGMAHEFFDVPEDERLQVFQTDGRSFLRDHSTRYDLIFVDVFENASVPDDFRTVQAFRALHDHLRAKGVLAMNIISGYYGPRSEVLRHVSAAARQAFYGRVEIFLASHGYSLWLPQNFVLTARKDGGESLQAQLRYGSVRPPEAHLHDVLED